MEKVLSVFVDESGDTGDSGQTSKYYIVSFTFHNQSDDITSQLDRLKNKPSYHVGPIIRKEEPYFDMDIEERAKLLRELLVWSTIKTKSFVFVKRELDFEHLKAIHRYLFQDLFFWAGKIRTVAIAKRNLFCLPQHI